MKTDKFHEHTTDLSTENLEEFRNNWVKKEKEEKECLMNFEGEK